MTNKPRKSLGQNFLTDNTAILSIVESLKIKSNDTIVEIGPGHGELTEELLKKNPSKLIAIEKDEYLAKQLANNSQFKIFPCLPAGRNFQSISNDRIPKHAIIIGDALKILPNLVRTVLANYIENFKLKIENSTNYKLVGNIPYYITGYLLRIIGELKNKPELVVLTIQKEVAERIVATTPKMNLLAASVQFWGKPEIIRIIPRKSFNPAPKVDSAVIKIIPSQQPVASSETYYKLIKILFRQPRKTILNNLKEAIKNEELTEEGLLKILKNLPNNTSLRPQNLSIPEILKMSVLLNKKR